jgi:hypothetical protein
MFKLIEPEVAGGLGAQTKLRTDTHPPVVELLHYEFSGWSGDDLLTTFPCYIVTERLKENIETNGLTGINFDNVIITKSGDFQEINPNIKLPTFY